MKKTAPSPKKNGTRKISAAMTPAVAEAVLQDAVMGAAADIAALTATLQAESRPAPVLVAETPEEEEIFELLQVPYLGRVRALALAAAGLRTMDDLRRASPSTIGGVKGVGQRNAERIKEWLSRQPEPAPENGALASPDPGLARANQSVQDALAGIDGAVARIKKNVPRRKRTRKLDRQLDRLAVAVSEVPESFDTLRVEWIPRVTGALTELVDLLEGAADQGALSEKKQDTLGERTRIRRKRLEKALGD